MTGALVVIAPGISATLQDLGRYGYQAYGVPTSGALDPVAMQLANWLAGNMGNEGAIEMRFSGPVFEVTGGSLRVALTGECADFYLPQTDAYVAGWRSTTFQPGQRFGIRLKGGNVCYLAVSGGFALASVLGSQSTLAVATLGGFMGRALAAGDVLPLRDGSVFSDDKVLQSPGLEAPKKLRVILGPQHDYFSSDVIEQFFVQDFKVSPSSNRMGMILEGTPLKHCKGFDLVSEGTVAGSIQVPGSGQPIILLADRGTTGGYPKIATVISADLPALGRIGPNATVCFHLVSHEEALHALHELHDNLLWLRKSIRTKTDNTNLEQILLEENIISGVTDGL